MIFIWELHIGQNELSKWYMSLGLNTKQYLVSGQLQKTRDLYEIQSEPAMWTCSTGQQIT